MYLYSLILTGWLFSQICWFLMSYGEGIKVKSFQIMAPGVLKPEIFTKRGISSINLFCLNTASNFNVFCLLSTFCLQLRRRNVRHE